MDTSYQMMLQQLSLLANTIQIGLMLLQNAHVSISCVIIIIIIINNYDIQSYLAVNCGPAPAANANGDVIVGTTTFKSTAVYVCDSGYVLDKSNGGVQQVYCQGNGEWSGIAPLHAREYDMIIDVHLYWCYTLFALRYRLWVSC